MGVRWYLCFWSYLEPYIMQEPSNLDIFTLISIWFRMVLTQTTPPVDKDYLTLTYSPNINTWVVLHQNLIPIGRLFDTIIYVDYSYNAFANKPNEWDEPSTSYKWSGWVWEITDLKFKDFKKSADHSRGIHANIPQINKEQKIVTCTLLDLETLGF